MNMFWSHDHSGTTDPFLRRLSDPEEEDDQRGRQQLPDEQHDPKRDVAAVSQRRKQVRLQRLEVRGQTNPKLPRPLATVRPHLVRHVVPVVVEGVDILNVSEGENHQVVTRPRRV